MVTSTVTNSQGQTSGSAGNCMENIVLIINALQRVTLSSGGKSLIYAKEV